MVDHTDPSLVGMPAPKRQQATKGDDSLAMLRSTIIVTINRLRLGRSTICYTTGRLFAYLVRKVDIDQKQLLDVSNHSITYADRALWILV